MRLFLLMVAGLSSSLFLPVMGRGFIHDDFVHLYSAAYHSLWQGLTCANGGPFYTPVTWLTFRLDWVLWGKNPFLMAAGNLLLHIANITLLYAFALKLWRSQIAARWAALGFALLFPANTWAVMWISTRAHLLVTFFYLATLIATLWLARAERRRKLAVIAIVLFATLSIFSKESGVTSPVAIAITLIYVRRSERGKMLPLATIIGLFGSLIAALAVYALIREQSEAIPITFSAAGWYSYAPSLSVLFENLFRYGWRTYGLLGIMAFAIVLSQIIRGRRPGLDSFTMNSSLLSASLFATTIAPFILLRGRSGIYTYLPGIAAALLLGVTARALYEAPLYSVAEVMRCGASCLLAPVGLSQSASKQLAPRLYTVELLPKLLNLLAMTPILLVIALYSLLTVVHSLRWMRMAEINTFVLNQIVERRIKPQPNTLFILTYSEADSVHGFPDSLAHGFSCALRMLYADPTLNGSISRQAELLQANLRAPVIRLAYIHGGDGAPRLVITSDESFVF
ncbi:MAG TPA: hypothetical protein VE715_17180 [Blastocatellia bacterium]|nr:hypothetical protein [Blastocatellia bacterium]